MSNTHVRKLFQEIENISQRRSSTSDLYLTPTYIDRGIYLIELHLNELKEYMQEQYPERYTE